MIVKRALLIFLPMLLGVIMLAAPGANAERQTVRDDGDAKSTQSRIESMTVRHTGAELRVRTRHQDLVKMSDDGGAATTLFIDSTARHPGPEFALVAGLNFGTDYRLVRVRNWQVKRREVACNYDFSVNWRRNHSVAVVARKCLASPKKLRVTQRLLDQSNLTDPVADWAPGRREFTRWLGRG